MLVNDCYTMTNKGHETGMTLTCRSAFEHLCWLEKILYT